MFGFFENLVDPFAPYKELDTPPKTAFAVPAAIYQTVSRHLRGNCALLKVMVATFEIGLIWYMGRIVDLLTLATPQEVMRDHMVEFAVAAFAILVVRTIVSSADVALLHNTILTNLSTLVRWRAHRHVLRQPVGWFENDFAGRIANRVMQRTPSAAGDAIFQVFDAVAFAVTTVIGSVILLSGADARLVAPLVIWIVLYLALLIWTVRRAGPPRRLQSNARSAVTAQSRR